MSRLLLYGLIGAAGLVVAGCTDPQAPGAAAPAAGGDQGQGALGAKNVSPEQRQWIRDNHAPPAGR